MAGYFGRVVGNKFFAGTPPSRYPGQSKYICWYIFAGNATCRDRLRRYPVQQNVPVLFRRGTRYSKMCRYFFAAVPGTAKCAGIFSRGNAIYMPEIDANEVNQLLILIASLTGSLRTVGFARSSEGDGCTRTRHTDTSADAAPALLFSTGVPIRSAHCSPGPQTLGGVGRWLVLVCTAAVHPIKNGSVEKESAPNQKKISKWTSQHRKKKKICRMKKKHSKEKKNLFGRKRTPHLDLIELHIISQRPLGQ